MKFFIRSLTLFLAMSLFVSVEAKTIKYDLVQLNSHSGTIQYPGLDFFGAKSAILTITKVAPLFEAQLTSLEITFPNAAKLLATNFKLIEGNRYRAIVNGAWVYKEVIVELDPVQFEPKMHTMIHVFVSERTAFINPQVEIPNHSAVLFNAFGIMRDITPTRIVDTASTIISNKKVTLSLKDRMGTRESGVGFPDGFIVDALWYGKGVKTLYLPAPIPPQDFDTVEVIGLIVEGTTDADVSVSVKFKDRSGFEITSPRVPLKLFLDEAYGPTFP
ncbi:MAG: hypothetical protein V4732_15470 [Pseudomonadota bacterium]